MTTNLSQRGAFHQQKAVMALVFDLGGVLLNWHPTKLLQQVWPHRLTDDTSAKAMAGLIFESFKPQSDWAQLDLGLIIV